MTFYIFAYSWSLLKCCLPWCLIFMFFSFIKVPLLDLWNFDVWKTASNNSVLAITAEGFSLDNSSNLKTGLFVTIFDGTIAVKGTLGNVHVLTVIVAQIRFSTVSNILIANVVAVDLLTAAVITGKWEDCSVSCAPWTRFVPNDMWNNFNMEVKN